jgi:V8-like Glu-specific endopeptidase
LPRASLPAVAAALALTVSGAAQAEKDVAVRPGEPGSARLSSMAEDRPPWTAVARVDLRDRAGGGQCTGTLVGASLVVTAAHCVTGRAGRPVRRDTIVVSFGPDAAPAPRPFRISRVVLSPSFRLQRDWTMVAGDWALLQLSRSPGIPAFPLGSAGPSPGTLAGDEILRAGFGGDSRGRLTIHRRCEARLDGTVPGLLLNRCYSAPGNSGSPVILVRGGEARLIGLHTAIGPRAWPGSSETDQVGAGPSLEQFAPTVRAIGPLRGLVQQQR